MLNNSQWKWFGVHLLAAVLVFGACSSLPVHAQVAGGTISGTILDSSGGAIPNAKIAIKNAATGNVRNVTTNSDGYYAAPNLLPASYEVTVEAQGFNTEVKRGIELTVGAQQTMNLTLQVGTQTRTVEVTTEAPVVQLTTSDISAVVNATTVRELPLNGRSWTDLATLQPGVDVIQTQPAFTTGADRGNRGFGQQLTISGARPQQNNYRLDGISLNDYANGAPGSVLGGNLGVDAIQEFSVLTSNYSAEYGKTSGGVVNAITRSGTNGFHGSAYEFLRNSALDAANFFENSSGLKKAPFKRNQFGGAVGGPIVKNRTFFFANYEGLRQAKGIAQIDTVPSLDARNGFLSGGGAALAAGACAATPTPSTLVMPGFSNTCVDNNALLYLPLYPKPNGAVVATNPDNASFSFSGNQIVNENFVTTRIDHKFTEKDSIFGTYMFDRTPYTSPDGYNNSLLGSQTSRQIVAVEETHSFAPTFLNSVRFGFNHEAVNNNQGLSAINPAAALTSLGAGAANFPGAHATQVFIGSGITPMPGGLGGLPTYFYHWNSFQVYDDAFWNKGSHSIKFGVVVERMLLQVIARSDPTGIWQFSNLKNFLTNNPKRFQGGIPSTVTPRDERQTLFGAYVQDDWRLKPYLTLNLGLRYEMTTVPTEIHGKLANLHQSTTMPLINGLPNFPDALPFCGVAVAGCAGKASFFHNPTLKNFEPRVGFAWDPFHNGKLAVRGGIGLFDVLPLPYQFPLLTTLASPFFAYTKVSNPFTPPPPAPQVPVPITFFSGLPAMLPANSLRATFLEPNPKRNYVTQWNLNLQYQLTPNLAAMVAYVGSRGVHQPFRVDDADLVLPTKTSAGYLWPNPTGSGTQINTNFGSVRGMFYEGRSYYDALEAQVSKRMSHGFQAQGVFTWSKSIDTSSATVAGDAFSNSISSLHWFDPKLSRAVSDFNIGRTMVLNGTWEVPSPKSFSGAAAWPLSGWQLGMIFTASDGTPFTASWGTGADPLGTNSSDDWTFPALVGGAGCKSLTNHGNPNNYIKTQCFAVPTAPCAAGTTAATCGFYNGTTSNGIGCDPFPASLQPNSGPPVPAPFPQCFNLRGNAGRNILVAPGVTNMDFSVFKNNPIRRISETFSIQFRMEIFNILNHANFAPPVTPDNTDIFDGTGASTGVAGLLTKTSVPERQIQFGLKIIF